MDYQNLTPFPSLAFEASDAQDQLFHVAVIRVTLDIESEEMLKISSIQKSLVLSDEFYGEPNNSSVRQESDLAPYKPWCDVVVIGDGQAPLGKPMSRFEAGIRISRKGIPVVDKRIAIIGPRSWRRGVFGWKLSEPESINSLPIRYEHAYGGQCLVEENHPSSRKLHTRFRLTHDQKMSHPNGFENSPAAHTCFEANSIGKGYVQDWYLDAKRIKKIPAPQIESLANPVRQLREFYEPEGLGIIGRSWEARSKLCGTLDEDFIQSGRMLPKDFDFAYWNGAHPDLQVPWLHGDETIDLVNIPVEGFKSNRVDSQSQKIVRLLLPGCRIYGLANFENFESDCRNFRIDTFIVDTQRKTVSLVYRLKLPKLPKLLSLKAMVLDDHQKETLDLHCQKVRELAGNHRLSSEADHG